jgi:DNA-binding XRE family transcriptional regulator
METAADTSPAIKGGVPHMSDEELAKLFGRMRVGTTGERLRACRLVINVTRAELSRRSGVHIKTLARIERGEGVEPREHTMVELARAFNVLGLSVNAAWLMWGADGPPELAGDAAP